FSASDGWLWAVGDAGHTGVVIAVFEDGSFLCANFNVPPTQAPTRGVSVTLIDGVDGSDNVHFFSGVGKAKFEIEK
ncbi:TPA: amidase, partial [Enterococcus faecium]|nr:amidase [Enterococcus faecium]